jgi:hypothetical protein
MIGKVWTTTTQDLADRVLKDSETFTIRTGIGGPRFALFGPGYIWLSDQVLIGYIWFLIRLLRCSRANEMANRTGKGYFVKGRSGNPAGRPKNPPEFSPSTGGSAGADRRTVDNMVIEARKFSGLAVDTLVELTKDNYAPSTRYVAATALLDRGYGRPAQSLDLHLSADAITKRLSDMTDAELAAL